MGEHMQQRIDEIVSELTLSEKAELCSGLDFWHTKPVERLGLPSIMVADGPHGLRKQADESDHLGIHGSVPATCFPPACASASSFDRDLLFDIGVALGEECRQENVSVILGPGANIKRSPLCGRNFEYFSEDPYVSGEMAAAMIKGTQSQGVGSCLKHFALNNQETRRMIADSVVDERAKREIYYASFEHAVRQARPWTMMCSYNKIDGEYASDNKVLLSDILRDDWGFEGAVITDWGAMNDPIKAIEAGCDLEMPTEGGFNAKKIESAVTKRTLSEDALNTVVKRLVDLALRGSQIQNDDFTYDINAHHELARRGAAASCVLLKNDDALLPMRHDQNIAIIGQFAKKPRYQGSGSSIINPTRIESACDALESRGIPFDYAEGYSLKKFAEPDDALIAEACATAKEKDIVLLFVGLPDEYESEGFDRETLDMPKAHLDLIDAVTKTNPNTVVILQVGAPVTTPWAEDARAILLTYLGGQASGAGCIDVLLGDVNPSGRLAESWVSSLEDTPCYSYFPGNPKTVEYRESIFVGYRYLDTAHIPVAWPFGFGLSYTTFEYHDLTLSADSFGVGNTAYAEVTITNTGNCAGADIVQLYIGKERGRDTDIFRAQHELKGFEKVFLQPNESRKIRFTLDDRCFSYFNPLSSSWAIEGGLYAVKIGSSSRNIHLSTPMSVRGDGQEAQLIEIYQKTPEYNEIAKNVQNGRSPLSISDSSFEAVLGRPIPSGKLQPGELFTCNNTIADVQQTFAGKQVAKVARKLMEDLLSDDPSTREMAERMFNEMPLRALGIFSGGALSPLQMEGIADLCNGKFFKGARKYLKKK